MRFQATAARCSRACRHNPCEGCKANRHLIAVLVKRNAVLRAELAAYRDRDGDLSPDEKGNTHVPAVLMTRSVGFTRMRGRCEKCSTEVKTGLFLGVEGLITEIRWFLEQDEAVRWRENVTLLEVDLPPAPVTTHAGEEDEEEDEEYGEDEDELDFSGEG